LLAPRICAFALAFAALARGQEALYVKEGSAMEHVVAVRGSEPLIQKNGKLIEAESGHYTLKRVPEFEPVFVSVRHLEVSQFHHQSQSGSESGADFDLDAELESSFRLEQVFLVLEMSTEKAGKLLFLREIGSLAPHTPTVISWDVPLLGGLGNGTFHLHLFVRGIEVLNSQIPAEVRERILDQMVAKRIRGATNRPPAPFVGPSPEYPPALRQAKVSGRATVHILVGVNGKVSDTKIVSASDPFFGAAASDAIGQWRFLPQVTGGVPTSVGVDLPFTFSP
jgi:TonB family protein